MKTTPPPTRTTTPATPATTPPSSGKTWDVSATNYMFSPSSLTIAVGDSVKVTNASGAHTFTSATWDSGQLASGQSYTVKFSKTGSYNYYCSNHQYLGMTGTITVK